MRIVLAIILILALGVFGFTFLGQSAAFYRWHNGSMAMRQYYPTDKEAARDFERRIWQGYPRWQEWAVIRALSGGLFLTGLAGFWIERRRRTTLAEPCAPPNGGPATPLGNSAVAVGPPSVS